jgi:hypothetical protein
MEDLKTKRAKSLVNAAVWLMTKGTIDKSKYTLNADIVTKVIERYTLDLDFLKKRYGIPGRAAMPKIAGLMAYAIVRFKPLVLTNGAEQNIKDFGANEWLAIFYGLCVSVDLGYGISDEDLGLIISNPYFKEWFKNFKYLLEERNYTAESLIMVFATLGFVFQNSYTAEV